MNIYQLAVCAGAAVVVPTCLGYCVSAWSETRRRTLAAASLAIASMSVALAARHDWLVAVASGGIAAVAFQAPRFARSRSADGPGAALASIVFTTVLTGDAETHRNLVHIFSVGSLAVGVALVVARKKSLCVVKTAPPLVATVIPLIGYGLVALDGRW